MDEIKLNTLIRPVDPRSTERADQKTPATPGKFDEDLQGAFARMDDVKKAASAPDKSGTAGESTAIQDQLRDAHRMYEDMMKAKQLLSQLYHSQVAQSTKPDGGEEQG